MRRLVAPLCALEPQLASHAPEMFVVLSDPAIYEFENAPPAGQAWLRQRYERLESRRSPDDSEAWLNWVIRLPDGRLAGYVQATVLPDHTAMVAYEINSRHWRQGLGSCAVGAVLRELGEQHAVQTFVAVLKSSNHRSRGLLAKLGFVPADAAQHARYRDQPDELVMCRAADLATARPPAAR